MKILYDPIIYKLQAYGGITVYFRELVNRISSFRGCSVFYIDVMGSFFRYLPIFYFSRERVVFHSSYYRVGVGFNIVNIVTLHDFTYEKFNKSPVKYIHILQKWLSLLIADGVICISESTRKDFELIYPKIYKRKKVAVIHNGVSESYSIKQQVEVQDFIVFVGARGGYKNFSKALEVVARTGMSLKVVGGGTPIGSETDLIAELKIEEKVEFLGFLNEEELNDLYNKASALLYPSLYEGFGIPVVEAMRAGCPVVAHNNSSIPEVSGPKVKLVDCSDLDDIVFGLDQVMKASREDIASSNFKFAQNFSWDSTAKQTYDFYREVLSGE